MNVLELRERVETALADAGVQVGTYTLSGGEVVSALNVGNPPEGTTADGLEVVIPPAPKSNVISTFGGAIQVKHWRVCLVKHDDDAPIEAATDVLVSAFDSSTPQFIDEAGDIAEQVIITIPDDPE